MDPPRVESAWPSMGIAHLSAWAEKGVVSSQLAPRDPGPPQTKMQPRHNFPRARTRSSQGYRSRACTPGKASTPATEAPSVESGGYPGSGGASPEELSVRTVTPLLPNLPDGSRPRALSQGLKDRHRDIASLEAQRMEQKRQELIQENMRQQELQEYHYRCQKLEREHAATKADAWTVSSQASRQPNPSPPSSQVVKVTEAPIGEHSQRSSVDERYEQQLQQELARQQQLELELRGDSTASISWLNQQKTHRHQEE
ncbi:SDH2-2, partial [Symbiodinium microadriaticum]